MGKFSKKKPNTILQKEKPSINEIRGLGNFKLSFQYLDTTQKYGSSFADWQACGWLSKMMETLYGYCHKPLLEQIDHYKFKVYGDFPTPECTKFKCPPNIPEDANWARIHILNRAVVVGHFIDNTFYVVFLDKTHKFYLTKKDRKIK